MTVQGPDDDSAFTSYMDLASKQVEKVELTDPHAAQDTQEAIWNKVLALRESLRTGVIPTANGSDLFPGRMINDADELEERLGIDRRKLIGSLNTQDLVDFLSKSFSIDDVGDSHLVLTTKGRDESNRKFHKICDLIENSGLGISSTTSLYAKARVYTGELLPNLALAIMNGFSSVAGGKNLQAHIARGHPCQIEVIEGSASLYIVLIK